MNPHFGNNADTQSYRSSKSPSYVERSMSNAFGASPPGMGPEHVFGALRPIRFAKQRLLSGSNTPPVKFVDETHDVEAHYLSDSENLERSYSHDSSFPSYDKPVSDDDSDLPQESRIEVVEMSQGIKDAAIRQDFRRTYDPIPYGSTLGLASVESVPYPLTENHEVRLMQYYITYMCTWFDLCDSRRHFANVVPPRAASCPTLLNAIFALSSRHLSLNASYDPYASDRYHQACLKRLSTISSDPSALNDDDLLAATILLRTLEELDVPLIGTDHEGHLLGIQLFMNTCNSTTPSGLRLASFWIGMRQEVTMSFASQRPVKIRLDHEFMDRSLSPADDDTWANRIVLHSADVINYCFGNNGPNRVRYQELVDYNQAWLRARPVSWLPMAYSAVDKSLGETFPHIVYLNNAVVVGQVHGFFARILLMCHDDRAPRIGPAAQLAQKEIDNDIRTQVRELCGIALSNPSTRPAMFTACMGVTACGGRFTEKHEQMALLDILILTEKTHNWPTASAQVHLKRAWGWED
uniref:ARCA protein n=1 Tax=Gibberella zeae (strain ATCC MYA-4620 / CBS 123657 / FGSC 9075 / NRRL 31084 / PH-1) TaxID=229533 RepID=A0A098DXF1_GIBZE